MQNYEILERYAAEEKRKAWAAPPSQRSKNCIIGISYTIERKKDVDFQPVFAIYTIKKEGKGLVSRRFLTTFASRTIK